MGKNGSIPSRNKKEAMFVTDRLTHIQTDRVNWRGQRGSDKTACFLALAEAQPCL